MREHSPVFEAMLSGAFIHQVAESLITVGHTAEALAARLSQEERAQALRASFAKVFGTEIDVRTIHAQPGTGPAEAGTVPTAAQQPKQSYRRPSRGGAEDTSDDVIPEPEEPSPEPRPDGRSPTPSATDGRPGPRRLAVVAGPRPEEVAWSCFSQNSARASSTSRSGLARRRNGSLGVGSGSVGETRASTRGAAAGWTSARRACSPTHGATG